MKKKEKLRKVLEWLERIWN